MPLQETSGTASYDAFGGRVPIIPTYIEDVFSTYLYTGNGSTRTITNGIDLAGKGGLVWIKNRGSAVDHALVDTARGAGQYLIPNTTAANTTTAGEFTGFTASGFGLDSLVSSVFNGNNQNYASWTFRKQPKFFDVVTFTGDGSSSQFVTHNLQSSYGFIVIKRTDSTSDWFVLAKESSGDFYWQLKLNSSAPYTNLLSADPNTSTGFYPSSVIGAAAVSGGTYVAYLFANNAGGFGLTGADNVVSCGSYTGNGTTSGPTINLGYEPQWVMIKNVSAVSGDWVMLDTMRGLPVAGVAQAARMYANLTTAEAASSLLGITSTGFTATSSSFQVNGNGNTMVYIAIRRGPMKTPTSGTSVFAAINRSGNGSGGNPSPVTTGIVTDLAMVGSRTLTVSKFNTVSRLTNNQFLRTFGTNAQAGSLAAFPTSTFDLQNGFYVGNNSDGLGLTNDSGATYINYAFQRAPGFMDVVCYTGTGSATNISHNLGAVPELMFVKQRSNSNQWNVYAASLGNNALLVLNATDASSSAVGRWDFTTPTSAVFTVGSSGDVNGSGSTYTAFLFASCPGVSKVGSYTGTGSTQTVSCGFAARFVFIKRTDSTGNWWVWDTTRGMVSGTDPRLGFNLQSAELNADWVYTNASGFQIVTTDATVNASGGSYIFLAVS